MSAGLIVTALYGSTHVLVALVLAVVIFMTARMDGEKLKVRHFFYRLWRMRSVYTPLIIHIYDTSTDIGVIYEWYLLARRERRGKNVESLDMEGLFWAATGCMIAYRGLLGLGGAGVVAFYIWEEYSPMDKITSQLEKYVTFSRSGCLMRCVIILTVFLIMTVIMLPPMLVGFIIGCLELGIFLAIWFEQRDLIKEQRTSLALAERIAKETALKAAQDKEDQEKAEAQKKIGTKEEETEEQIKIKKEKEMQEKEEKELEDAEDQATQKYLHQLRNTHVQQAGPLQKAMQLGEAVLESLPEVIMQSVFMIRSLNDEYLTEIESDIFWLIIISIIASILSITNKYVWIDEYMVIPDCRSLVVSRQGVIGPYIGKILPKQEELFDYVPKYQEVKKKGKKKTKKLDKNNLTIDKSESIVEQLAIGFGASILSVQQYDRDIELRFPDMHDMKELNKRYLEVLNREITDREGEGQPNNNGEKKQDDNNMLRVVSASEIATSPGPKTLNIWSWGGEDDDDDDYDSDEDDFQHRKHETPQEKRKRRDLRQIDEWRGEQRERDREREKAQRAKDRSRRRIFVYIVTKMVISHYKSNTGVTSGGGARSRVATLVNVNTGDKNDIYEIPWSEMRVTPDLMIEAKHKLHIINQHIKSNDGLIKKAIQTKINKDLTKQMVDRVAKDPSAWLVDCCFGKNYFLSLGFVIRVIWRLFAVTARFAIISLIWVVLGGAFEIVLLPSMCILWYILLCVFVSYKVISYALAQFRYQEKTNSCVCWFTSRCLSECFCQLCVCHCIYRLCKNIFWACFKSIWDECVSGCVCDFISYYTGELVKCCNKDKAIRKEVQGDFGDFLWGIVEVFGILIAYLIIGALTISGGLLAAFFVGITLQLGILGVTGRLLYIVRMCENVITMGVITLFAFSNIDCEYCADPEGRSPLNNYRVMIWLCVAWVSIFIHIVTSLCVSKMMDPNWDFNMDEKVVRQLDQQLEEAREREGAQKAKTRKEKKEAKKRRKEEKKKAKERKRKEKRQQNQTEDNGENKTKENDQAQLEIALGSSAQVSA